jgi:hypothetical protein
MGVMSDEDGAAFGLSKRTPGAFSFHTGHFVTAGG